MIKTIKYLALVAVMVVAGAYQAYAVTLFARGSYDYTLYTIDTMTLTTTAVGTSSDFYGPEIELNPSGTTIFASQAGWDGNLLYSIDPLSGLDTGSQALAGFPFDHDTLTAMEFVGTTMYAASTDAGPEADSAIVTVDTGTGALTLIGDTLLDPPLGGLAYDVATSTMYGVNVINLTTRLIVHVK